MVLVIGFGVYFAWGIIQMARKHDPNRGSLGRRYAREITVSLVGIMMMMALLQAWQYKSWQPFWVLGAISVVTILAIMAYLPSK
jgi:hypothetical protein